MNTNITSMLDKRLVSDTNLSEETRARIEAIQRRMEEQGVTNVRFSWNYEQLLKDKPNAYQSPLIYKQQHLNHAILWGNGRAYIHRVNGVARELIPLIPDRTMTGMIDGEKWHVTKPIRDDRLSLLADMQENPETTVSLPDKDVFQTMGFTLDGINGISLVKLAASTLGIDTSSDNHSIKQLKKGYAGGLMLEAPVGALREEAKANDAAAVTSHASQAPLKSAEIVKPVVHSPTRTAAQKKEDALLRQQRSALTKPLKKSIEKADAQLIKLQSDKTALEEKLTQSLTPSEIAEAGKQLKSINTELENLEAQWLAWSEELEKLETE